MSKNFELLANVSKAHSGQARKELVGDGPAVRPPVRSAPPLEKNEWHQVLTILGTHWRAALLFALVTFGAVVLVTALMKPVYESTATLEIESPGTELFSLNSASISSTDSAYLETQAENLRADDLAVAVIRKLHLDKKPGVVPSDASKKAAEQQSQSVAALHLTKAENDALAWFRDALKVKRETTSRLVRVSFEAHDPELAAQVAATVVSTFLEQTHNTRHAAVMESSEWLARQLQDIRDKMEQSNRAVAEYQQRVGIADIDNNQSTFSQKVSELNKQLTQAQADRIQFEAYMRQTQASSGNTLPLVRDNPVSQQLAQKLADAKAQLAQASALYGPNHPNVKKLNNEIDVLTRELQGNNASIMSGIRNSYNAALSRERMIGQELRSSSEQLAAVDQYASLKKEAERNTDLYNKLYGKIKEAGIAAAARSSNMRVVDQPRVLSKPTRPNWTLNLVFGFLAGIVGGVLVAFIRSSFDHTIRTLDEVQVVTGLTATSVMPLAAGGSHPAFGQRMRLLLSGSGAESRAWGKFLLESPHSPESEAIRGLETAVRFAMEDNLKTLLVASGYPGEGKTMLAANLAIAMARRCRVCLIDADLRRPSLHQVFNVPANVGFAQALAEEATLRDCLHTVVDVPNLTLVPAGAMRNDCAELLSTRGCQDLLNQLSAAFDVVLVDSAPLIPFVDGRAISTFVDRVIFVARCGVTTKPALQRSMSLLAQVGSAPVLEIVLNGVEAEHSGYGYGYGYGVA